MEANLETVLGQLSEQIKAQQREIQALRKEVAELRAEQRQGFADLKSGRQRSKPQSVSNAVGKPSLANREMSKMMFVSWASRQPVAFEGESAEARQRRLLPQFEGSNNCRVLGVDHLR